MLSVVTYSARQRGFRHCTTKVHLPPLPDTDTLSEAHSRQENMVPQLIVCVEDNAETLPDYYAKVMMP